LAGQTMDVDIRPGTTAAAAYGASSATERYYCNFGLNADHVDDLEAGGLRVSGTDADGEVRIVELPDHPFFLATLFVPQARSTLVHPSPFVSACVSAGAEASAGRSGAADGGGDADDGPDPVEAVVVRPAGRDSSASDRPSFGGDELD